MFRPDVAAYEYLTTGDLLGKKVQKFRLNEEQLSDDQKVLLPSEFYGPDGVDPDEFAKLFGYHSGDRMIERLGQFFIKWGYLDRDEMLNKIIDEELDRRKRKASAGRRSPGQGQQRTQ